MLVMRAVGWSYVRRSGVSERSGGMHLCFIRITGKGQAGVLLMLNGNVEYSVANRRKCRQGGKRNSGGGSKLAIAPDRQD